MRMKSSFCLVALAGSAGLSGCAVSAWPARLRSTASASAATTIQPQTSTASPSVQLVSSTAPTRLEPDANPLVIAATPALPISQEPTQLEGASVTLQDQTPINLPSALACISSQHPVVEYARWRVQESYAQLDRAKVMWLPSIQTGANYRRRDGNYQAVDGSIVDVNLNSLNFGLGAGAVAAGSPTRPGLVAQFHLADAIFLPEAAKKNAWARGHAANATVNQQLLQASLAYMDLLEASQDLQIIAESNERTSQLATITKEFAQAGEGLQSDADRMATEHALLRARTLSARERQLVASTRLARALSLPMSSSLVPQDAVALPLQLQASAAEEAQLIATGLEKRPELKESQALVAAACEAYQREKYAPFVPSVLLGFSTSSFGGGLGNNLDNIGGRYDIDALMMWEVRNLGFGEQAARRERSSQVQQATYTKLR